MISTAVLVIAATGITAEVLLRLLPIPGIRTYAYYYDDITGSRYVPHSTFLYRNARGDVVRRRANSFGYLDREHDIAKRTGTTRIGFFGDSYTEARQVPLDSTFHRRLEREMNTDSPPTVECIAVSRMAYGTLQSYLEYERWADSLDLDCAVYVFCENDLADLMPAIRRDDTSPYPLLVGDSLLIDVSFRERYGRMSAPWHRAWEYLRSRSLLVSTVWTRLHLLWRHGVKLEVHETARQMASSAGEPLSTTSLPSAWPDSLAVVAQTRAQHILRRWHDDARLDGRAFMVIYIPRESEFRKPPALQDSWRPWLTSFCQRENIRLLDPTPVFVGRSRAGAEIYYDHLTPAGHRALADTLASMLSSHP